MKKAIYIFFCFYFIALTAKPCTDREDCNEFKQTEMSKDDHQKQHADEICTPFCVCSCCATHVLVTDYPSATIELISIDSIYKNQEDSKVSSIIISVWQPPKLA